MVPLELYITEAKLNKTKIMLNMGLKCNMQTMVGQKPKAGLMLPKIVLKPVENSGQHNCVGSSGFYI